ncbi:hypothetical protein QFZ33_000724 [Arthrobacter globiformis]|nr:hypothetical protein [Arthrobacter globiformis]
MLYERKCSFSCAAGAEEPDLVEELPFQVREEVFHHRVTLI